MVNIRFYNRRSKYTLIRLDNCLFGFMSLGVLSELDKQTILLGEPFLKKYYTIFDHDEFRVGFSEANHKY
jgi:hypothetical protein